MQGLQLETLLLCLPAGLFWLWYVYRRSRFHPPPLAWLAMACVAGGLSTQGVIYIGELLTRVAPHLYAWASTETVGARLFFFIVLVGGVEETCKMLAVRYTVYYNRAFDEAMHGVVYSSAAALGFATVENARYVDWHGASVLLGRGIMSTFGHVLMSMVWGFAVGLQRTRGNRGLGAWLGGWGVVAGALALSAVIHGVYDLLLVYDLTWLAMLLIFVLWRLFVGHVEETRRRSPHRPMLARRVRECPICHGVARGEAVFCGTCGRRLEPSAPSFCSACLKEICLADARCPACQMRLV